MPKPLYKTTLVIWSAYHPIDRGYEIDALAREAVSGDAYCARERTEHVSDPLGDPDAPSAEFFGLTDEEEA